MKQSFYFLFMALLLAACTGSPSVTACHQAAEALLSTAPDSACALLAAGRDEAEQHGNRRQQMYHRLLTAEAMNKSQREFVPDTALHEMLYYFDRHGTANLRLRAYYAMGCAYRNADEAPAALHYYTLATEKADTTRSDCDYATLFRVYGQMARIYGQQNLPGSQLIALEKYCRYALLAKDTISYILGIDHMSDAYYILGDSVRMLEMIEKARNLYLERGFTQYAAQVYPTAIHVALENKNYAQARKYMDIFEQESGIFDEEGNIEAGREHYYNYQGKYFLGIGKLDSAENYYRKLLPYERYHHLAYEGLLYIYLAKHNTDSIAKYVPLFDDGVRYWVGNQQSAAIVQSSALYDYTRNEQLAERKAEEARLLRYAVFAVVLVFVLLFCLLYRYFKQRSLEKEIANRKEIEELIGIHMEYQQQCQRLSALQSERTELQRHFSEATMQIRNEAQQQIADMEKEIADLKRQVDSYRSDVVAGEEKLLEDEIVRFFREMAKGAYAGKRPTQKEWDKLAGRFRRYMPQLHARMQVAKLTEKELRVCILTYLQHSTSDLAALMELTSSRVSNLKTSANKKLFSDQRAFSLLENLRNSL